MSFIKFLLTALLAVLLLTLPAIYVISGQLTWGTVLQVVLPFLLALTLVYFLTGARSTTKN